VSHFELEEDVERWVTDGKQDTGRWAANGLGIWLHDKQLAVIEALQTLEALFYLLTWANRVGKTTLVIVWHLHGIFYKPELPEPETDHEHDLWLAEDYRTLHTAPLGLLATRAFNNIREITNGTHPAQKDENGRARDAPLASSFSPAKERDAAGADHMVVKSSTGGTMDFFSTEGGALRLESMAWRRISWDEWTATDAADKATEIRRVLMRLQNRASDFDSKILLTGTITPETEHIAKEWIGYCEDPSDPDWWGSTAARTDNPAASAKAIERAMRTMDQEDIDRVILGVPGGVKGRLFPSFMVDPVFANDLPRFSPPHPLDGANFVSEKPAESMTMRRSRPRKDDEEEPAPRGVWRRRDATSPWEYLHIWDLAIAAAANVGQVWRVPADWRFGWFEKDGVRTLVPIEGVKHVEIPGSRTLTDEEITHTIEETYLPYGGRIVLDTTDAHGKAVHRTLRRAGYPVEDFGFQEREKFSGITKKDAAIESTRKLLGEGMALIRGKNGEVEIDAEGVPKFDREVPYGVLRLPKEWHKAHDQMAVLRPDDDKQVKDEAMVVLMGSAVAYRIRRARTRQVSTQPQRLFGRRRR
jgi:hypothetical protein